MRQPTPKLIEYALLRDEALKTIPDNIDLFSIKKDFQMIIPSKRRFERVHTIGHLIKELEQQLIIFPDKKGIQYFYALLISINTVHPQAIGSNLLIKVEDLSNRLKPPPALKSRYTSNLTSSCQETFNRVPNKIRDMLAMDLELCGGRDWEHFLLGLGSGLEEQRDKVRIKQGEVDNIERQRNGDIRQIIDVILTIFEDRCIKKGVNINILEHLMDILKNVDIFQTPLKMTANKIKMEKKRLENNQV